MLEGAWLLVAILVPLGVSLWSRQPFELPKTALLRSLVGVMAALWLAECWLRRRAPWDELRGNPLLWPVLALALVQSLATVLGVDRGLSLWGSYERSQGLLTLLSYLLLFVVVSSRLRSAGQARRLLVTMAATGVPLVGLGLAQALGWDPVGLVTDARSPVYGTLGRSNFLGAYLAILLPLTVSLAATARGRWARLGGVALVAGELVVIGLTLARGAWLAAVVALAGLGLLWFWDRLARRVRRAVLVLGLAGLGAGLVAMLWLGSRDGSTAARLTIWRAMPELIAQRPLLGHGPESLGLLFSGVYPPQLVYYQGRGLRVDRAHNLFLDWAATTGLLGVAVRLGLLAVFFAVASRALRRAPGGQARMVLVACTAAVAGNLSGNLVSFDLTATATATWLLMAVTAALAAGQRRPGPGRQAARPVPGWMKAGLALLGVAGLAALVPVTLRPVLADVAARAADRWASAADLPRAASAGERAVALWPAEPAHHLGLSWIRLQQAVAGRSDPLPLLRGAEAELVAACDLRPGDYRLWAALGELYGVWGSRWDPAKLPRAHDAYRQATALAPNLAILYTGWGMVYLESGDVEQAAVQFRRAVDLDATDGYAFAHLGDAAWALGRVDEALAAYLEAVHWEPELGHAYLGLARCYWQLGLEQQARLAVEHSLQLDAENVDALALWQQMGAKP